MNAAISAAWKALPESLRSEYKQRAQALKVGSAPPPEATALTAAGASRRASQHLHPHAQPASTLGDVMPPAAVNIAANIGGRQNGAGLNYGAADAVEGAAVPGRAPYPADLGSAEAAPAVTHNGRRDPGHLNEPFHGAHVATEGKQMRLIEEHETSEPTGMMAALDAAEDCPKPGELPQADGVEGMCDTVNAVEGGDAAADSHASLQDAPAADIEPAK